MTTKDFTANVISASKVVPDGNFKTSKASGVWDINEALDLIKGGNWPNAANIDPASFVDALFQTHLYTGNSSTRTITNGIDLSSKGGLVWIKDRDSGSNAHLLYDTERGAYKALKSSSDAVPQTRSTGLTGFTSSGFTLGSLGAENGSSNDKVSWTFRKQPKFFDIVTYTGDDSGNVVKSHSLGSTPGMIIIKNLSSNTGWDVFHRSTTNGLGTGRLFLHNTNAEDNTSTQFLTADSSSITLTHSIVKTGGENYVAYLFAHNNDDGGFGEPGDQDIIKCGSYTGNTSTRPSINLGFEPQFLIIKRTDSSDNWYMLDTMRGIVTSAGNDTYLYANTDAAEATVSEVLKVTATGFELEDDFGGWNASSGKYIYMAIRRGGMQTPTAASDVFEAVAYTGDGTNGRAIGSISKADLVLVDDRNNDSSISSRGVCFFDRLRGENSLLMTQSTDGDSNGWANDYFNLDQSGGWRSGDSDADFFNKSSSTYISWTWARARGYFDMVAYTGTGSARTVSHNLGVAPEMMWFKCRSNADIWTVYHSALGEGKRLKLNADTAVEDDTSSFNNTAPTSSVFSVGSLGQIGGNGRTYIAYLFATVADVSKVGSYTGNSSSSQNIDCGFTTSGVKFLLIKSTSSGDWYVWDDTRGIASGNDSYLRLNNTAAETTNTDHIDTFSTGFTVNSDFNVENEVYIFYAIARG